MTAWQPDDHELDAVARSLPAADAERGRAEELRTSLLTSAAMRAQLPRRSRVPVVAIAVAAAAAVVGALWFAHGTDRAAGPGSGTPIAVAGKRQFIGKVGNATFRRVSDWPDFLVRIDDGRLAIEVASVGPDERFRVITTDAEVRVRGTKFEVAAAHGLIAEVVVREGTVELRADQHVILLHAGETWTAPHTASRDVIDLHPSSNSSGTQVAKNATPTHVGSEHVTTTSQVARNATPTHVGSEHATAATPTHVGSEHATVPSQVAKTGSNTATHVGSDAVLTTTSTAPKPGEDEFRAGWTALRTNDPAAAAKLFATACAKAHDDAIGEDACFWAGAAAKRANDTATARTHLARFLDRFPSSARTAEAAALLGWILYDAHDLDAAETQFHRAENDRVPKVRDSARKGLEAIARSRTN